MENNNERENDRKPDRVNISVSESETYSGDTGDSEENPKQQSRIEGAVRADGKKYVEKGSLNEAELIADKKRAKKAKSKDELTEEEKREERRAANRLSAFQSRQRRLSIIEDLQVPTKEHVDV